MDQDKQIPGLETETYRDVKPEEVDNFRLQAALFLAEEQFGEADLAQIHSISTSNLVDYSFNNGLTMQRMTFPTGTITELYRGEGHRVRIVYEPALKAVKVTRETIR